MNNCYDTSYNNAKAYQRMTSRNDTPHLIGEMFVIPWNDCPGSSILMAYAEQ
ncbi:hypothetical protein [Shewanella denitrificans]|jgi:hypothetical protein|uniref:hypothetical protein n=1 Tax=Shewanella denitrificans TaxID=192073 RepID=UPI0002F62D1A|nr:hypothetical protein [Shewanella denitrificans]